MDKNVTKLLEKVKVAASKTGEAALYAVDTAGQATRQMAQSTKLSARIFDMNNELDILYKEAGKMVYDMRQGIELSADDLESRFAEIDAIRDAVSVLRQQLADAKQGIVCASCGHICAKESAFCSQCGLAL